MANINDTFKKMSAAERALANIRHLENTARSGIERRYMKKRNNSAVYIALEDLPINFFWTPKEVGWFDQLWKEGWSITYIAETLERNPIDVALLIMDRNYKKKIKPRKNGIWG